jgi:hypothetical protein
MNHELSCLFRKALLLVLAVCILSGCSAPSCLEHNLLKEGRARFEVFGMLSEYMGRDLSPTHIESFYPHERTQVKRFEQLLNEFAVEEGVAAKWKYVRRLSGHHDFSSEAIAQAINRYYPAQAHPYAIGAKVGYLTPIAFRVATKADLLRFIKGAYCRYGDRDHTRRAILNSANDPEKMFLLANALQKLGCTDVKLFRSKHEVPTSFCLVFTPSPDVVRCAGIRRPLRSEEFSQLNQGERLIRIPIKVKQL